ncbi:MAG: hypothetical protein EA348_09735 [Pseudomonadaceae bacterium]|nr:MAG: hypothetical protein EA348_09735 [Pseudomonadaceae bacterium]
MRDNEDTDSAPAALAQAAAAMPPVLGGGCLSRYDLDALGPESGTDYAEAQQLLELSRQSVALSND